MYIHRFRVNARTRADMRESFFYRIKALNKADGGSIRNASAGERRMDDAIL